MKEDKIIELEKLVRKGYLLSFVAVNGKVEKIEVEENNLSTVQDMIKSIDSKLLEKVKTISKTEREKMLAEIQELLG